MNVFAGMNGAGKSTVIQSLLALRQSWESDALARGSVLLNGELTELGTCGEVYCAEPNSEFIELCLTSTTHSEPLVAQSRQSEETAKGYILPLAGPISQNGFELFNERFNYLHAERLGPRKAFQIPLEDGYPFRVGRNGENAPFIVSSERKRTPVSNSALHLESSDGLIYDTLEYQWPLWMSRLFPGYQGKSEIYHEADQIRLSLALQTKQTGQGHFVRPTNTGFGLSYVLGVIVAGLVASSDSILIVENPEAHLHPRAQSCIGEFLARVSAGGAQVFVETHSEHVLNGMRRMVKAEKLPHDGVRVFYFSNTSEGIEPHVTRISISKSGDVSEWPDGFFDQLDQDLSALFL